MNAIYVITLHIWHDLQQQTAYPLLIDVARKMCVHTRRTTWYLSLQLHVGCDEWGGGREVIMGATTRIQATAIGSILPTPWASRCNNVQSLPNPRAQLSFWLERPSHLLSCLPTCCQPNPEYVVLYVALHVLRVNAKWNTQQLHCV